MADEKKSKTVVASNRFYLLGVVDHDMQKEVAEPMLKAIQEQSLLREGKIKVFIQGPGGYWDVCNHILSLFEIAKAADVVVETIVVGAVCSASSIIAVAGTPGHRFISKTAEHLIHYGSSGAYGTSPTEIERDAAYSKRFMGHVEAHYKRNCSIPSLHSMLQHDNYWIPAQKCVEWKLADGFLNKMDLDPD